MAINCTHFIVLYNSLDRALKEIESDHSISVRWSPLDKDYMEFESKIAESKQEHLLMGMWKAARRRKFLLELKAKYAGMMKQTSSPVVSYSETSAPNLSTVDTSSSRYV